MTKCFPSITNLLHTVAVTLTECLCQPAHDYTQASSSPYPLEKFTAPACKTQRDRATKKRKRKQNRTPLRTSQSSVQEIISLQFKNSFRFNLRTSVLKFWKTNMYIFTAGKKRRQKKKHLGSNPNLWKLAAVWPGARQLLHPCFLMGYPITLFLLPFLKP